MLLEPILALHMAVPQLLKVIGRWAVTCWGRLQARHSMEMVVMTIIPVLYVLSLKKLKNARLLMSMVGKISQALVTVIAQIAGEFVLLLGDGAGVTVATLTRNINL
ncbi:hypothetical protein T9A_02993 [Alcanivorax jadensis T9]|uniref:Uncharacterized protein n=1 Tax=Alcanivorax jadensis T9 TaxID=1177181 RepID=A0ABR4W9U4_9GAMM|nr:hypothetical protein T9A_02993 [Alcanivorax jadensis T9]